MTAPDWKRAPHWARWAAMDATGAWYWFEAKPALSESLRMWSASGFKVEGVVLDDWQNTAEERPSKDGTPLPKPQPKPTLVATELAEFTLDDYRRAGWTDDQLIERGFAKWF